MKNKRGLFITFEGGEGAGKTTQIELFKKYLEEKGYEVEVTREPGGTLIGEKIRELLLDVKNKDMNYLAELLLYYASRAQHLYEKIIKLKNEGKIVICDRFSDSTLAYQGFGRGLDKELIKNLTKIVENGNGPDITFLIDIEPKIGLDRARKLTSDKRGDRMEQEKIDFYEKVRDGYLKISEDEPERVKVIDGNQEIKIILEKLKATFEKIEEEKL
ncbi:dTMP kinase [Haliovirga abyssi]|uniref:Thymidylate kinase n=1 Tax=Haliovirga abyssi TaxID=2996794 RepID=A0AAU9DC09_9FUSO|nr:dTMP kinase [Haliovirga abyssi]BDU49673.1 thymidylate kinase [Haliovirga abyssi]